MVGGDPKHRGGIVRARRAQCGAVGAPPGRSPSALAMATQKLKKTCDQRVLPSEGSSIQMVGSTIQMVGCGGHDEGCATCPCGLAWCTEGAAGTQCICIGHSSSKTQENMHRKVLPFEGSAMWRVLLFGGWWRAR